MSSVDSIAGLVLMPLAAAALAWLLPQRWRTWLLIATLALCCVLAVNLAAAVSANGPSTYALGGWSAPLGIPLRLDALAAVMLLLTQLVGLVAAAYSAIYLSPRKAPAFWPLLGFLITGLNALFVSYDLFNLFVTLEMVSLAAVGLVASGGARQQIVAAQQYLVAALIGSAFYLLGVALLYGVYGTVSIADIGVLLRESGEATPALVEPALGLILLGLMFKAALVPLHYWLPTAHGSAMPAVSALLSALVVKAAFFILFRCWLELQLGAAQWVTPLLLSLGAIAIVYGSWQAVKTPLLKEVVAYSTVAQVGYLFLTLPLIDSVAISDATYAIEIQMLAHGLAKAAMFMAVGTIIWASGITAVNDLNGIASRFPIAIFAFALAGVSLIGLPPSGGFLAKWYLLAALLKTNLWPLTTVVLLGGLLAAWYVFRVLNSAFVEADNSAGTEKPQNLQPRALVNLASYISLFLAALSIVLGLQGQPLYEFLRPGAGL